MYAILFVGWKSFSSRISTMILYTFSQILPAKPPLHAYILSNPHGKTCITCILFTCSCSRCVL